MKPVRQADVTWPAQPRRLAEALSGFWFSISLPVDRVRRASSGVHGVRARGSDTLRPRFTLGVVVISVAMRMLLNFLRTTHTPRSASSSIDKWSSHQGSLDLLHPDT